MGISPREDGLGEEPNDADAASRFLPAAEPTRHLLEEHTPDTRVLGEPRWLPCALLGSKARWTEEGHTVTPRKFSFVRSEERHRLLFF